MCSFLRPWITLCLAAMMLIVIGVQFVGCATTGGTYQDAMSTGRFSAALSAEEMAALEARGAQRAANLTGPGRAHLGTHATTPDPRRAAPPGSLPALDEEVWVIVPPNDEEVIVEPAPHDDRIPGAGGLITRIPHEDETLPPVEVPLPLDHTAVNASIAGFIASVNVQQRFRNPYDEKIEAIYVFPLPQNAAVNGFIMTIGERRIRGIIREHEEAQQIYRAARQAGHVASLLTQERPNIFMQRIANIEPGRGVDIDITYFHTLTYDDGWYEWVYPMVVGPRFHPPHVQDGVAAMPRGTAQQSAQQAAVTYLAPHERSGHDIDLSVALSAGVRIEEVLCATHDVKIAHEGSEQMRITLAEHDTLPNRDFVLRYRVAGEAVKAALMTCAGENGDTYFALMLHPPGANIDPMPRRPLELIFVIDCSGSMSGAPHEQAKGAVLFALDRMQPEDTFQVIRFSNEASQFGEVPLPATPGNVRAAQRFVNALHPDGGTMMIEGVRSAIRFPHDPQRLRYVVFLTDGFIGNEREILAAVQSDLGGSRIFSFGVGSSPNRFLMNRMAKMGRGVVSYLNLKDDADAVMDAFFTRIEKPVLTDIALDFGDANVTAMTPAPGAVPDLFHGRPVIVLGKCAGELNELRLRGRVGAQIVETTITTGDASQEHTALPAALPAVWARMHISDLMDRAVIDEDIELEQAVTGLALSHGLMSAWTSFVAVDGSTITEGDRGTTVPVAVPVPAGVEYETTVAR